MSDDVVIRVEGLWKHYGLPLVPSLRRYWRSLRSGRGRLPATGNPDNDGPWALRDINLEVKRGETLGIIGPNGAGKTTLLKVLAGVTPPTRGNAEVRGSISPMIALNAGVHRELTGRENIFLLGAILGLSRREIQDKMPSIEEFCELGGWLDEPVRKYSSGMLVRLGFAVAMNVDAEILLIDEVLAVGDISFRAKCYRRMRELVEGGRTIVFVSHSMEMVSRLCSRTVYLNQGEIHAIGETEEVISMYERDSQYRAGEDQDTVLESADVTIQGVRVHDGSGRERNVFGLGERLRIGVLFSAARRINSPNFWIGVYNSEGIYSMVIRSDVDGFDIAYIEGESTVSVDFPEFELSPGIYWINVHIFDSDFTVPLAANKRACRFEVRAKKRITGVCYLKRSWSLQSKRDSC